MKIKLSFSVFVEALEHSEVLHILDWTYFSQYASCKIPGLTTGSGTISASQLVHNVQSVNTHWATLCLPNSEYEW